MPRLLIGQGVHHRLAEFDEFVRGDGAQGQHIQIVLQRLAAAPHFHFDAPAHAIVEHVLEREELRDGLAVDRHQDIARRQNPIGAGTGLHVIDHQHAGQLGIRLAHAGFSAGVEAEPLQLIVRACT